MRPLALWILLFAAYAATLGIEGVADERPQLLIADSIASGGELLRRPEGIGFALLIAPAQALGGARAVELMLAAIAALGFVLAAVLARRIVPEPYASAGAAVAGLSPPALAYGATVLPELTAATLLAGAALCAVVTRERPRAAPVIGGGLMLAALPWLRIEYVLAGAPVAVALALWAGRGMLRLVAAELKLGSLVFYVTLKERLYGGPTPYVTRPPGASPTGAGSAPEHLERITRLAGGWLDRDYGLLRWAPFLALAFFAGWLLWRSRRERLARVIPARATAEAAAGLALAVCAGQLLVAVFAAPTMYGEWFPGRHLVAALPALGVLCAWGVRHAPRTGAVLAALTVAGSAWLLAAREPWWPADTSAPWGPLEAVFPSYRLATPWGIALAAALALLAVILAGRGTRARGSATGRTSPAGRGRRR